MNKLKQYLIDKGWREIKDGSYSNILSLLAGGLFFLAGAFVVCGGLLIAFSLTNPHLMTIIKCVTIGTLLSFTGAIFLAGMGDMTNDKKIKLVKQKIYDELFEEEAEVQLKELISSAIEFEKEYRNSSNLIEFNDGDNNQEPYLKTYLDVLTAFDKRDKRGFRKALELVFTSFDDKFGGANTTKAEGEAVHRGLEGEIEKLLNKKTDVISESEKDIEKIQISQAIPGGAALSMLPRGMQEDNLSYGRKYLYHK